MEHINDLDEAKILGYFETLAGTFLLKCTLLGLLSGERAGKRCLKSGFFEESYLHDVANLFDSPLVLKCIRAGNIEILDNFQEDINTSILFGSWTIFEQVIKDLTVRNFATSSNELALDYHKSIFGFSKQEKKDLDFFYYLRNAYAHTNGAFAASKPRVYTYDQTTFNSKGKEGVKMTLRMETAWKIARDIEKYALKAWSSCMKYKP